MKRFDPRSIPSARQYSLRHALANDSIHNRISDAALHVGVSPAEAKGYLNHLVRKGELPRTNKFAVMLRKSKLHQAKKATASKRRGVRR